jgi:hypothetical protein
MARVTRLSWVSAQIYLAVLVLGSLAGATWMFRFFGDRGGFAAAFAGARAEGLRATLLVGAPIWLCGAAAVGLALIVLLRRRKAWALVAAALAAPVTLAAVYCAHRLLLAMEDRFYDRSKYVSLYHKGAYPLVALTALFALALALDVLVVARRRAA